jgi:hypothetical protein
MFSGLAVIALVMGAPVQVPEVTSNETVRQHMGGKVVVLGQLERVPMSKGGKEWQGTGLVLDDDTIIYVTYAAPPEGWAELVGARVRVEGLLLPSQSEHEQSLIAPHLRAPGKPKKEERSIGKLMGSRVRLSGIAQNAKGGAILLIKDSPYYLEGVDSWPKEAQGKLVGVGGKLVDKQYLPEVFRDAKGVISQGAEGSQNVIEAPTWRVIQALPEPRK